MMNEAKEKLNYEIDRFAQRAKRLGFNNIHVVVAVESPPDANGDVTIDQVTFAVGDMRTLEAMLKRSRKAVNETLSQSGVNPDVEKPPRRW